MCVRAARENQKHRRCGATKERDFGAKKGTQKKEARTKRVFTCVCERREKIRSIEDAELRRSGILELKRTQKEGIKKEAN